MNKPYPYLLMVVTISLTSIFSFPARAEDIFSEKIISMARSHNFSGSILVSFKGTILVDEGFGFADQEHRQPITSDTVFPIASITKLFVKHSIFLLQDKNQIKPDDRLDRYLPEVLFSKDVTIKNLVQHTSGFHDLHNELPEFNNPAALRSPVGPEEIIIKINDLNSRSGLLFNPGTQRQYSNSNYLILALVIERITGISLDSFLKTNIFDPFDMPDTGLYGDKSRWPGHAKGFFQRQGRTVYVPDFNFRYFWGSGNAYSKTHDLLRYLQETKKSLKPEFSRQLIQHTGYYLGYRSYLKFVPELDLAIILLSNNGQAELDTLANGIMTILTSRLESYQDEGSLDSYCGSYWSYRLRTPVEVRIWRMKDRLVLNGQRLLRIDKNIFLMPDNGLASLTFDDKDHQPGTFLLNDGGEVLSFRKRGSKTSSPAAATTGFRPVYSQELRRRSWLPSSSSANFME
ncbi:MAG: beta-lactamase family protein [Candidatus Aminicenantes bacterium]|nr:beta-lactamase family protein [Candidatus Aminicenantes bacterium]